MTYVNGYRFCPTHGGYNGYLLAEAVDERLPLGNLALIIPESPGVPQRCATVDDEALDLEVETDSFIDSGFTTCSACIAYWEGQGSLLRLLWLGVRRTFRQRWPRKRDSVRRFRAQQAAGEKPQ